MSRLSREKSVSRSHRDRGLIRRDRSHSASKLSCAVHLGRCLRASQWVRRSPLVLCNRANGAVGRTRGSMMRQWAWFSSVLHMGAGPWPLLTVLFRMILRFPPTPSARECATHTTPGHASTSPGLRVVRVNMRATPAHAGTGIRVSRCQVFTPHHPRRMQTSARELTAAPAAYAPPRRTRASGTSTSSSSPPGTTPLDHHTPSQMS